MLGAVEGAISMELEVDPANDCVDAGVTGTHEAARAAIAAVLDWLASPEAVAALKGGGVSPFNYGVALIGLRKAALGE